MLKLNKLLQFFKWLLATLSTVLATLFISVNLYINRDIKPAPSPANEEYIYYYAYGSNMSTWYLNNIRHTAVYWSRYGTVRNYTVMFNSTGIQYLEPSFANLVQFPGGTAHGVVHKISKDSFNKIKNSESELYQLVPVEVFLTDGSSIKAITFVGQNHDAEAIPSKRYLSILIRGAEEHNLPETYVQNLSGKNGVYIPVISEFIGTIIYLMVILRTI